MNGDPVEQMHPGLIAYLPPGKKVAINNPSLPSGFDAYQRVGLHEIAAGLGLSYEVLTGDLSQVNFSSIRLGLNEQNRMIRALREQVFVPLAMEPIWQWFCEAGQFAGLLPLDADAFPCRWSSPRVESVDRKTDAEADLREMRNATRSRRDVIASYGQDPDAVDAEIAMDIENRRRFGIVSDGDPGEVGPNRVDPLQVSPGRWVTLGGIGWSEEPGDAMEVSKHHGRADGVRDSGEGGRAQRCGGRPGVRGESADGASLAEAVRPVGPGRVAGPLQGAARDSAQDARGH